MRVKLFQTSTFVLLNTEGPEGVLEELEKGVRMGAKQLNRSENTERGVSGRITIIEELKRIQFKNHHRISARMHFG